MPMNTSDHLINTMFDLRKPRNMAHVFIYPNLQHFFLSYSIVRCLSVIYFPSTKCFFRIQELLQYVYVNIDLRISEDLWVVDEIIMIIIHIIRLLSTGLGLPNILYTILFH